ncbi:hypothetical protein PSCICL_25130 [Pseudomonas cichorii]|nr:hypothetical protein PSCICL_25130 [Pseudomonas cichorii]
MAMGGDSPSTLTLAWVTASVICGLTIESGMDISWETAATSETFTTWRRCQGSPKEHRCETTEAKVAISRQKLKPAWTPAHQMSIMAPALHS